MAANHSHEAGGGAYCRPVVLVELLFNECSDVLFFSFLGSRKSLLNLALCIRLHTACASVSAPGSAAERERRQLIPASSHAHPYLYRCREFLGHSCCRLSEGVAHGVHFAACTLKKSRLRAAVSRSTQCSVGAKR